MRYRQASAFVRVVCAALALGGTWAVLENLVHALREPVSADAVTVLSLMAAAYGLYLFGFIAVKGRLPAGFYKAVQASEAREP